MQAAMSQAIILDPYARAVMRKTAERIRSLGEKNIRKVFRGLGLTNTLGFFDSFMT